MLNEAFLCFNNSNNNVCVSVAAAPPEPLHKSHSKLVSLTARLWGNGSLQRKNGCFREIQPAAQHKHWGALCNPFDTHISEALAILENALVQGEVSLQGEECAFSVCVYKFLYMQHAWQPDWGHGCVLVRFSWSMMLESQLRKTYPGLVSAWVTQFPSPPPPLGESDSAPTVHHPNKSVESKKGQKRSDFKSILNVCSSIKQQAIS